LSNGLKIHFEQHGSGTPLILLHGFGQHGGSWDPLVPSFARFFKVIVPDLRGCGRSEAAEPGFTVADMASDIVALMDEIGLARAHVAGWSQGGTVALELGLGSADRLISLSLHSTYAGGRDRYQSDWIDMRRRIIASGDRDLDFTTRIIGFFTPEFINARPDRIEEFRRLESSNRYPPTPKGMAGQVGAAQQFEARDRIGGRRSADRARCHAIRVTGWSRLERGPDAREQAFRRQELAGSAINNDDRVLNARAIRVVNVGQGNLQTHLLKFFDRQIIQRVRQEHSLVTEDRHRNKTDKKKQRNEKRSRARAIRSHQMNSFVVI